MKSNYKRIGDCIRLVDNRNDGLKVDVLLGLSISKEFIPSVANIIGADMENYKVIRKNQFACSTMQVRRDKKMPVALLKDVEEAIISSAYPVFEVIDEEFILPEYLMMWFRRPEFDREACFYAIGGVRGSIEWDDFCSMKLPVPSIYKQREIIREYQTVVDRINLNNDFLENLEDTAQSIYKQWFVDFEFPNEDGQTYKSNGGEMHDIGDEEIPIGWRMGSISDLADIIDGDRGTNYPSADELSEEGYCLFLNASNVTKKGFNFDTRSFVSKDKDLKLRKGKLIRNDIVLTTRGTVGNVAHYSKAIIYEHIRINSGMVIIRAKDKTANSNFIYTMFQSKRFAQLIENYLSGSAQQQLPIRDLSKIPVLLPENDIISRFEKIILSVQNMIDSKNRENFLLKELAMTLLSKLATVEDNL